MDDINFEAFTDEQIDDFFDGSLSDSEIVCATKVNSKFTKSRKKNVLKKGELVVHTQFCGFSDEGLETRKPCSVKFCIENHEIKQWIEAFRFKMNDLYVLKERTVQYGHQFVLFKNAVKYVSAIFYNSGTVLIQGLGACLDWKNKHYESLQSYVKTCLQNTRINSSADNSQTALKQLCISVENTDVLNVDDSIRQDSNETVPIEK